MDKKENPLKTSLKQLAVGGQFEIPNDEKVRTNAHNHARFLGMKIKTQRKLDGTGLTIVRTA